jgi:hypothetical protein
MRGPAPGLRNAPRRREASAISKSVGSIVVLRNRYDAPGVGDPVLRGHSVHRLRVRSFSPARPRKGRARRPSGSQRRSRAFRFDDHRGPQRGRFASREAPQRARAGLCGGSSAGDRRVRRIHRSDEPNRARVPCRPRHAHRASTRRKSRRLERRRGRSVGDVLVFSDANSLFLPGSLRALVAPFKDPAVGGVAGDQTIPPRA